MVNSISSMNSGMYPQVSIKTKTHNRESELYAHRNAIVAASQTLVYAVQNGDSEGIKLCNDVIDAAQKRINEIINQEDGHTSRNLQEGKAVAETIVKAGEKIAPMVMAKTLDVQA